METFFKPIPQELLGRVPQLPVVLPFIICAFAIFVICTSIDLVRRYALQRLQPYLPTWLQ